MSEHNWEAATFEGAAAVHARELAALTPPERVVLLEQLLEIAQGSGALQRERELKQREIDKAWYGGVD